MITRAFLLAGIAALLAMPAAAQVTDYRLPAQPTPTPAPPPIVGPVLGTTPTPRPSPAPTPAPPPTVTAPPSAAPTAAPRIAVPPLPTPTASPIRRSAPAPAPSAAPAAAPTVPPAVQPSASPAPAAPLPTFAAAGPSAAAPAQPARSYWPWVLFVFLLGGAGFAGAFWLRRRIGPLGPVAVPEIERPRVPPAEPRTEPPAAAPAPLPPASEPIAGEPARAAEATPLHIAIELRKLTITLMNATLSYRLTLTNGGADPVQDIAISADLVGAHSSLPREAQLAGPGTELPPRHRLAGIASGESGEVTGELRVPLHELRPIAQGGAALFVPLARFRIAAHGREPRWFTLVAGQPSPSGTGAVQPVRLDLGPRIYDGLAGRAF